MSLAYEASVEAVSPTCFDQYTYVSPVGVEPTTTSLGGQRSSSDEDLEPTKGFCMPTTELEACS